ncbi:hypothetical protein SPBRAN_216 [uncultured Candidatus Thioglobus sp.]|nr:hypothetical protein SPBRAN_216 [uncultured Candidatus Thioglobus sp.]
MDIEKDIQKIRSFIQAGEQDRACDSLLDLLKKDPDNRTILLILGGEYFVAGKHALAKVIFEKLVLLAPDEGKISIALFNTLQKLGLMDEALEEMRRFLLCANKEQENQTIQQYNKIINLLFSDAFEVNE